MSGYNLMVRAAFLRGFRQGSKTGRPMSAREASVLNPDLNDEEVNVYLNGVTDGIAGDTSRTGVGFTA